MIIDEIDKYKIIEHLGSGSFGNVYLAEDRALSSLKAIKILDVPDPNDFLSKFEEAQILNKCRHAHIVNVNEANLYDVNGESKVVIDMEYISGGSLEDKIKNSGILPNEAINYFINILFAIEFAHNRGILHRDIKPANILICQNGAKLTDFGLATIIKNNQSGSPKGYITHLAPEYFINKQTTILTEIYAIGISLFRTCCGIKDWRATIKKIKNYQEVIKTGKIIQSLGYPDYLSNKIRRIINKACNIEITKRYQSALEMRAALEKLSPKIKWKQKNKTEWNGKCPYSDDVFNASLSSNRKGHTVNIKRNGRRITSDCKKYLEENDAIQYLYKYISESSF